MTDTDDATEKFERFEELTRRILTVRPEDLKDTEDDPKGDPEPAH